LAITRGGAALGFTAAASSITNTVIDTAGEHTHIDGCVVGDTDGELGRWADGITADGTGITIENNTVINASDIGIVFFGGRDARIAGNTVISGPGSNGAFAGIAVHTWGPSDVSGLEIVGNTVISESDTECGGVHAGINVGTHMWGGGCRLAGWANVGNAGTCETEPVAPNGAMCMVNQECQLWAHIAPGGTMTFAHNVVRGSQINYLIEGLDVQGDLVIEENLSESPQETDWHAASFGCPNQLVETTWGTFDYVARHPTIPGWDTQLVHCEW
jgi:parallel beta-helix repeat protein